jgi:uncharacterized protein
MSPVDRKIRRYAGNDCSARARVVVRLTELIIALAAMTIPYATAVGAQKSQWAPSGEYPRQFGYIAMTDQVKLAYVVYLPKAEGRFPAILQYEPYVGAGTAPRPPSDWWPSDMWLKNGYALVFANVRGTGCSQGVFDFLGPHEGPDGAAIVDWIGRQSWSDGRVGMTGVSYPGHTQILVAAQHPVSLKAIAPSAVTASTYSEIFYPGGILNVSFTSEWGLHLQPSLEAMGVKTRIGWGDMECEKNHLAHPPNDLFQEARAHPFFDQWWKSRSLEKSISQVDVPTFVSGTWQDHQTMASGATELYEQLKGPKRLTMSPRGHGSAYLEEALQRDLVRWMNLWVKGLRNGIEVERPVTIYWEPKGQSPKPSWITHYDNWPPKNTELRTFWLTSAARLSTTAPSDSPADTKGLSYTFPIGVELVGGNTQFAVPPNPNGSLTWTSVPFVEDSTILGSIEVKFYAASQNTDTDFEVALHDVYPNGDVEYLQRGFLRASLRAVAQNGATPAQLAYSYDKPEYLVPGQIYEIRLSLPPLGAVLRKGHQLQMVILAPSPIPQPDWGLMPVNMPGENIVYASVKYPSKIIVPLIVGAKAGAPEPACGSIPFQPCRRLGQPAFFDRFILKNWPWRD